MQSKRIRTWMAGALLWAVLSGAGLWLIAAGEAPDGWFQAGSHPHDYKMGVNRTAGRNGDSCAFIESRSRTPAGFGTLMQMIQADAYRGQRLRLSGYVKPENIEGWAGLWMRIDGPDMRCLGFDNMGNRPIKGTSDWQYYEIVLDVPPNSVHIAFGILLHGAGRAWLDDLDLKVVEEDVPTTDIRVGGRRSQPANLDFEE